jgi:hypothetical protein
MKLNINKIRELDTEINKNFLINTNPEDIIQVFNLNRDIDFNNQINKNFKYSSSSMDKDKIPEFFKTKTNKFSNMKNNNNNINNNNPGKLKDSISVPNLLNFSDKPTKISSNEIDIFSKKEM